ELQGSMDLDLDLAGGPAGLSGASFEAGIAAESFTDATGRYAGEQVNASLSGKARPRRYGWEIESRLTARQGAVYIEPLYVEVADQPIVADLAVGWWSARRRFRLHSFNYRDPGTLRLAGTGMVETGHEQPVRELQLELQEAVFPAAYERYLQPWLTGTLAGNLELDGGLHGTLQVAGGQLAGVSVDLQGVSVRQNDGLFGFDRLTGELDWSNSTTPEYSTLAWDGGHVYRIDLGTSALEIESTGNSVRLVHPVRIPVLDGALDIEAFGLGYPAEGLHWEFDGILTPVSLQQMTRALGWPEFGGKLSGVIPSVRYDRGVLTVGGVLLVRVFDGVVTLRGLQLTDPFGLVPRLQVDAMADNIDLETLTGAFSFGRIEGRLDGRVDGLMLESWRPVAFDAEFATPVDDKSRHRISQKAVDNISNIGGGGVGGALSRGFLQFLEDFPYARLGIRCRLENGVCDMGGVEPAENGYYLVKGRFLPPRLDVVGYASRVDWDSLVAQIIAVTREKGVVVE
ncbi:MAG: hypothetical protein KJO66_02180, partial [Gammaproteobacteria bacterium]|nr:hypothetical protein [Gammaproteobacteria bacterium]